MRVDELIKKINNCVDENDFVTARKFIERNLNQVERRKQYLNRDAREILNFVLEQQNSENQMISSKDLSVIKAVNTYASNFDLNGIKLMVKQNPQLFLKDGVANYLNNDAKIILDSLGLMKS